MICCVRSAIVTASSVGSASASSSELVCSDCVPPSTRRERLQRRPHHVVVGLLRRQAHARRLRVEAQHPRARVLGLEALAHRARPDPPRRAVLGDLLEEVAVRVEEEREPRREARRRPSRRRRTHCTYSIPSRSVNASSWAAVAPGLADVVAARSRSCSTSASARCSSGSCPPRSACSARRVDATPSAR